MKKVSEENPPSGVNETDLKHCFFSKKLWHAFCNGNKKLFEQWLERGANPEKEVETNLSTFELLCKNPGASEYIFMCLDYIIDPSKENPQDGLYPIHHAVQNLAIQNTQILLEADPDCANQTLKFNKTPLHLLTEVLDDSNLNEVFEIIQIFSKFGGDFSWPARQSGNQTPFSMLLEKLATLQDKATCLKIISYLIGKYPKIDMFHRKNCAEIIERHFQEIMDKYKIIENRKQETNKDLDWKLELERLIVKNEVEFLVKFDIQKKTGRNDLEAFLCKGVLIILAIEHNRFESFVEIYGLTFNVKINDVIEKVLSLNRCRMLKFLLNHESVPYIDPIWMKVVLEQMNDKEIEMNPSNKRCFHILLDHKNYDVNEQISEYDKKTAINLACSKNIEYAIVELLKKGASLGTRNNKGQMAISFVDNRVLRKYFDSCITKWVPEDKSKIDYFMVIDFSFLKASKASNASNASNASKEMPLIEYMTTEQDLQPLIEHPVIASFLFLKWLRLSNIFFLNLLLFSINAMSFSIYLIFFYVNQDKNSKYLAWLQVIRILANVSFIMILAKEISQFVGSPKTYLKSAENYFEMGMISLMALTLTTYFEDHQIRRSIAAVLFMGFAIEWTMLFSALPVFSVCNYIVMLEKVTVNFLRMLAFYSIILLAFILSFYTLINKFEGSSKNSTTAGWNKTVVSNNSNESEHSSIFSACYHVILMLTGDYGNISEGVTDITIGRIFLIVFVLSMSIVMMNLLVGLTVSDTVAIEREAEWYKWWERAKLLRKYECIAGNCLNLLENLRLNNTKMYKMLHNIYHFMPEDQPMNKIRIEVSTHERNKFIYAQKSTESHGDEKNDAGHELKRDIEGDPFQLPQAESKKLFRSFLGCFKVPLEMNERIIESGLKVLEYKKESKAKKARGDKIKDGLTRQKEIEGNILKIEQKLDQLLYEIAGKNNRLDTVKSKVK